MAELRIPLGEAIRALRKEIVAAVREGQDEDLRFGLGPIELELQMAMSREAGAEAGISFWIVTIGGKASTTSAQTHTVRLTLTPIGAGDEGVLVTDEVAQRPK